MSEVRVRFAPSPTGYLHVGGARTAIFNWLFARHHGGTFLLRIEDTDLARSQGPMTQAILDGLSWLALDHDEGPFHQAQDRERHVADARRLLEADRAYRCFCPADALRRAREAAAPGGPGFQYARTCRGLSAEVARGRAAAGEPFAVRFRVPDGDAITWHDRVHGPTTVATAQIEDFVLLRSDGTPTYMLSVVSDDVAMRISHVIRGDDHVSNTPKQILLYRALGAPEPTFAHLPLILGEDRKRLSKRHGAVSLLDYRDRGFLPEAMFNFLSLLGWSPDDDRQLLDRQTLVREFDLDGVGKAGAVFDLAKLEWLNGEYIRALAPERLAALVRPWFEAAGLWRDAFGGAERGRWRKLLELLQPRCRTLGEFALQARPLLDTDDAPAYDPAIESKYRGDPALVERLGAWRERLSRLPQWEAQSLERELRALADERGVAAGKLIHPTRFAVTGGGAGPGLFEVLELLGRERTLERLESLIRRLNERLL
jgi:glutamyl-tRNA synthetase